MPGLHGGIGACMSFTDGPTFFPGVRSLGTGSGTGWNRVVPGGTGWNRVKPGETGWNRVDCGGNGGTEGNR
eukprot:4971878-Prymnesium_polylepis.1